MCEVNLMEYKKLNNNKKIPILGIGTWQLTGSTCTKAIQTALEQGYTHIDTAEAYGNEGDIGKALEQSKVNREDLVITSKLWMSHYKHADAINACNASLEKLGTDYLDLYLMHWPDSKQDLRETMRAMKELYETNKIKAFGVSNFTIAHLKKAIPIAKELDFPITTNQIEFHPGLYQEELVNYCKDNDIAIEAYSPLTRGKINDDEVLKSIADKYNKTPAQIALRWIIDKDIIAIPKASSEEHIVENLDIFDFTLDDEDAKSIDSLGSSNRLINPPFAEFHLQNTKILSEE